MKQEEGLTLEFTDYWGESEYKVLFAHEGDYSFDGKKSFYTALLKVGPLVKDVVAVNLILSNAGGDEAASDGGFYFDSTGEHETPEKKVDSSTCLYPTSILSCDEGIQ